MFRKFLNRRKLVSLVRELAIYNDKGIAWKSHDANQATIERKRLITLIQGSLDTLEHSENKATLKHAIESGSMETDIEGKYIAIAKLI